MEQRDDSFVRDYNTLIEHGTMLYDLEAGKMDRFAEDYQGILMKLPSYHDLKSENSYHMMMLGMCAFMQRHYEVSCNRENGSGREISCSVGEKAVLKYYCLGLKRSRKRD